MFLALMLAATPNTPQLPPKLTPAERETVDAREVVVRLTEESDGSQNLVAVIDVDAPAGTTLDAVLDVEARADEVSALDTVTLYLDTPSQMGADYAFDLPGYDGHFFILYDVDRARGFAYYAMDTSKDNDIESAAGSYQVFPRGQGTRLVYRVSIENGGMAPMWVKKALITRNLPEQLKGMRSRAEDDE